MLRNATWGAWLLTILFVFLSAAAVYLPFLEATALTPAIVFIHRFSITLNIGGGTKTLQPIVFVIPILFVKGLLAYHRRYGLQSLVKQPLSYILALLIGADLISILTSTDRTASIGTFLVHGLNLMLFITITMWLRIVYDMLDKSQTQKIALRLGTTFAVALSIFMVVNAVVSVSQLADCAVGGTCHVWATIDKVFPNKLLEVGHQKFSYKPNVIRAPGFFGDVNFNGMVSLLVVFIASVLYIYSEICKGRKGFEPTKEQKLILIPLAAGSLSYLLTLSRSALVGFGGVVLVSAIALVPVVRKNMSFSSTSLKKFGLWAGGVVVAVAVLLGIVSLIPLTYQGRKTSIGKEVISYVKRITNPEDKSAQTHASLFQNAVTIGNQRPLFGMGMGTFPEQYAKVINPSNTNANPHSTYGLLYAEQGIVGLIAYLIFIGYMWFIGIKFFRNTATAALRSLNENKRFSREEYLTWGLRLLFALIGLGIPFFSLATISYYGFFLPMTWWWGSTALITHD